MGRLVTYGSYVRCSDKTADRAYSLLLEQAVQMVFWLMRSGVDVLSIQQAEFVRKGKETGNQTIGYKLVCEMEGGDNEAESDAGET